MKQRNGQIDFWRFVGSIMIVMIHYYKIRGEYIFSTMFALWVEFFFMVTGYFLAASIYKTKQPCSSNTLGSETVSYTLKKVGSFYHFFIFFAITAFIARVVLLGVDAAIFNDKNLLSITDFLMLYATGMPSNYFFVGEWYLSAMILAVFVIYPFARRYTNIFENIIAPITVVFLFGIMFHNDKSIISQSLWYGFVMKGFVRAIAGICLGIIAHKLTYSIKNSLIFETTEGRTLITIIDIIAIPLATALMIKGIKSQYSSAIIFFLFIGIVTSFSEKSALTKLFSNKLCTYLGKLSLTIYMAQGTIILIINSIQKKSQSFNDYIMTPHGETVCLLVLIGATLLLAAISLPICNGIKSFVLSRIQTIKEKAQKSGQN